jgi:translation elongation factor EF-1beta
MLLIIQGFPIKILAITIVNTDKASTTNTIANAVRANQNAVPNIDVV